MGQGTWAGLVGVILSGVACVPPMTAEEKQAEQRARYEAANEQRERYDQASRDRARIKREEQVAENKRADEARAAARTERIETAKKTREDAARAGCDVDRDARMAEIAKIEASEKIRTEMLDWEHAHCKSIDNSKPVTRVVQDSRGEYHTVAGRDRGVDFVCDAKKPAPIAKTRAANLEVYEPSRAMRARLRECERFDDEAD